MLYTTSSFRRSHGVKNSDIIVNLHRAFRAFKQRTPSFLRVSLGRVSWGRKVANAFGQLADYLINRDNRSLAETSCSITNSEEGI